MPLRVTMRLYSSKPQYIKFIHNRREKSILIELFYSIFAHYKMKYMKIDKKLLIFTLVLIAVATLCKFFFGPNLSWSGFSPVIAIALFSGMLINNKGKSFFLPLIAVFASDMIIEMLFTFKLFPYSGFYTFQLFNYALLLGATLIGWALKGKNYGSIAMGGIIAPTVFFLLSNFGSWMIDTFGLYTNDLNGLMTSYKAGLPFYRNALASTMIFLPAIVLCYNAMIKRTAAVRML